MARENPLNRRLAKLQDAWDRKLAAMDAALFTPDPPFQVRMSEKDAFRKYMEAESSGALFNDRESNGGFRPDSEMDRYVSWGEHMKAKYAPQMLLNDTIGRASAAAGLPWDMHALDQHQHQDEGEQNTHVPLEVDDAF